MCRNGNSVTLSKQASIPPVSIPPGLIAAEFFKRNFRVIQATGPEHREISHRLRYRIFCLDRQFDLPAEDGLERDIYDEYAVAFLIEHRPTGTFVGTGRIIPFNKTNPLYGFPFQRHLDRRALAAAGLAHPHVLAETCEISRVGIIRGHRSHTKASPFMDRRIYEGHLPFHLSSLARLGLLRGVMDTAWNHVGATHAVYFTDALIAQNLKNLGVRGQVIGKPLNINGPVKAVHCDLSRTLCSIRAEFPAVWTVLTDRERIGFRNLAEHPLRAVSLATA